MGVQTHHQSVFVETDAPGSSKKQVEDDPAKGGTRELLSIAQVNSSAGMMVTVDPSCGNNHMSGGTGFSAKALPEIVINTPLAKSKTDDLDGMRRLTFVPNTRARSWP